jgi:hypothetical protein
MDRANFLATCKLLQTSKPLSRDKALGLFRSRVPEIKKDIEETAAIVDFQREDYVSLWLEKNKIQPADCEIWSKLFKPEVISVELENGDQHLRVSWKPLSTLCFKKIELTLESKGHVTLTRVVLSDEFCVQADQSKSGRPNIVQQDFNFDGFQDIRIFGPLTISHSRQFSLVFLGTKSKKFVRSLELEQLDGFEVDEKKKVIRSRDVDPNGPSKTVTWLWKKGRLMRLGQGH